MRTSSGEAAQAARRSLRLLMLEERQSDREHVIAHLSRAGFAVECRCVDSLAAMQRELGEGNWNAVMSTVPCAEGQARGLREHVLDADEQVRQQQELQRSQHQEAQHSLEKLRESERLRDSLVHMIVHDLRSPLSAVFGYLEVFAMQARDKLGPEAMSDIAHAMKAVQHMARMINGILDVHTMESQMMKLDVSECDLVQVVGQSLDELESLVGHRQVAFEHPAPPAVVMADSEIVARIVQNLLANALRLTPVDGEIRVGIVPGSEQTRVFVTDTGPGISADFRAKIFDKYAHAEQATSGRGHTTGLGLTFCKLAVEAHGGQIGVDSEEGTGSTFWFTLPSCQLPGD